MSSAFVENYQFAPVVSYGLKLESVLEDAIRRERVFYFLLNASEDGTGRNVGFVSLSGIENGKAEVCLFTAPATHREEGALLVPRAMRFVLEFAFHGLGTRKVTTECLATNALAIDFFVRRGFRIEGKCRERIFRGGKCIDTSLLAIGPGDWRWGKTRRPGRALAGTESPSEITPALAIVPALSRDLPRLAAFMSSDWALAVRRNVPRGDKQSFASLLCDKRQMTGKIVDGARDIGVCLITHAGIPHAFAGLDVVIAPRLEHRFCEAVKVSSRYCFTELGVRSLQIALLDGETEKMEKLRSLGWRVDARLKAECLAGGRSLDEWRFALTYDEFKGAEK